MSETKHPKCSFCGKPSDQVKKLIAAPNESKICDECVLLSVGVLASKGNPTEVLLQVKQEIAAGIDTAISDAQKEIEATREKLGALEAKIAQLEKIKSDEGLVSPPKKPAETVPV